MPPPDSASSVPTADSTKVRILKAAEVVFAARGFAGASTREIAARAGVNISSLHYHWESKETLYLGVFRDVVARIEHHLRGHMAALTHGAEGRGEVVARVMGSLFDFFEANPTIPKLIVRRIVEEGDSADGVEREVLVPAWDVFSSWLDRAPHGSEDLEGRLFMLSVHSVLLLYLLDSPAYRSLLGGSVRTPRLRDAVRRHVIEVVDALLERRSG